MKNTAFFSMRNLRLGILSAGALVFLAPYIWMISTAAKSREEIFSSSLTLLPQHWALWENLAKALTRVPMGQLLWNGLVVCGLIFFFQVVIAIPCAYAMANNYTANGDPEAFTVVGDRLFLNFDMDTRSTWLAERDVLIAASDQNWPDSRPGRHAQ